MTTTAQVRKLLKPLIGRHSDLTLVDRLLVVKPVRHILRGILIGRTREAMQFYPQWFAVHLFEAHDSYHLQWGGKLRRPGLWLHSDPDAPEQLYREIEIEALPRLRTIDTISDWLEFLSEILRQQLYRQQYVVDRPPLSDRPTTKVVVDVALGDLRSARAICSSTIAGWSEATYGRDEDDKAQLRRLKELCARLAANDRQGLARLLHEWEAITVKNLKLEHLWEPTPFPLEEPVSRS